jgi:hypothetical protein
MILDPGEVTLPVTEAPDALGILKVQADGLDLGYLWRWGTALGVADLVERAVLAVMGGE